MVDLCLFLPFREMILPQLFFITKAKKERKDKIVRVFTIKNPEKKI